MSQVFTQTAGDLCEKTAVWPPVFWCVGVCVCVWVRVYNTTFAHDFVVVCTSFNCHYVFCPEAFIHHC